MTNRTISAMFDKYSDATAAVNRLEAAGVPHDQISIVSNDDAHKALHGDGDHTGAGTGASLGTLLGGGAGLLAGIGLLAIPGLGPVVAAGWLASTLLGAGIGAATGGLAGSLVHAGIDESDAHAYAEGVRRGGTLVTVRADEALSTKVADILDDHGTIDMDDREVAWRKEGWTGTYGAGSPGVSTATGQTGTLGAAVGAAASAVGTTARNVKDAVAGTPTYAAATDRTAATGVDTNEAIPIMEERLRVGKREENRGRVRIHSYVVETPVQEQVTLRDERVQVDRKVLDRPASADEALFKERTLEATAHTEVPVVSKETRVTGEVGLRKQVDQRTETVSDKLRKTQVDVEDELANQKPTTLNPR